jgi:hypothetical protein
MGDNDMAGAAAVAAVSNFSRVIREADCVDTARFMAGWLYRGGAPAFAPAACSEMSLLGSREHAADG